jgi:DNA primase
MNRQVIDSAKSANLIDILTQLGLHLVREGHGFYLAEHDSLKFYNKNGLWYYKWFSRSESGDAIHFLQRYFKMNFQTAVHLLLDTQNSLSPKQPNRRCYEKWPSPAWINTSLRLIRYAENQLFSDSGKKALRFLTEQRGLTIPTIKERHIGWLPSTSCLPSKILIPCFDSKGLLLRIRFRLDAPVAEPYRIRQGSNNHSPFPLGIMPSKPIIIVESELDAILIYQETHDLLGVLAIGSVAFNFSPHMLTFLNSKIPLVIISLDNDHPGENKSSQLVHKIINSLYWSIPKQYGKDPGEAWQKINLREWILSALNSVSIY